MARALVEPWAREATLDNSAGLRTMIGVLAVVDPAWAQDVLVWLPDGPGKRYLPDTLVNYAVARDADYWQAALAAVSLAFSDKAH